MEIIIKIAKIWGSGFTCMFEAGLKTAPGDTLASTGSKKVNDFFGMKRSVCQYCKGGSFFRVFF